MKVVLISCVSKKKDYPCKAVELYDSTLFKSAYEYAKRQNPDQIFILSAKYGLLKIDEIIEPYNETLNAKSIYECKTWAEAVIRNLRENYDLQNDEFVFLAGDRYRKYLLPYIKNFSIPLEGLPIGKQLKYYKDNLRGAKVEWTVRNIT